MYLISSCGCTYMSYGPVMTEEPTTTPILLATDKCTFVEEEAVIGDSGFQGPGRYINFPYRKKRKSQFRLRSQLDVNIQTQNYKNEWFIGVLPNRFQLFLGKGPF